MIECCRVITGACKLDARGFISSLKLVKDEYTIKEIVTLTKGQ